MENEMKLEKEKKIKKPHRPQSLGEEIGNAVTHGCGAIFGIVILVLMCIKASNGYELASGIIFGLSTIFIYISSCLYHAFRNGSKVKKLFRVFDHSSIYIQIAGTYAPVLLCGIGLGCGNMTLAWVYFAIQWFVVLIGILARVLFPRNSTLMQVVICLVLGWSGLSVLPMLYQFSVPFFWLILGGGLVYSIGIVFYSLQFKYSHFIWHFFVLGGTILHFIAIFSFIFL